MQGRVFPNLTARLSWADTLRYLVEDFMTSRSTTRRATATRAAIAAVAAGITAASGLALNTAAANDTTAADSSISGDIDPQIVGGSPVRQGTYPWMAHLYVTMENRTWTCGGSLVSPDIILTAAHCVKPTSAGGASGRFKSLKASIGHVNWRDAADAGDVRTSSSVKMGRGLGYGDWAVVKLDRPMQRASYPAINGASFRNSGPRFTAIGWGNTSSGGRPSADLLTVTLPHVPDRQCSMSTEYEFCAGTRGKATCQGDSGGPLLNGGVITGLTSWGIGCGNVKDEPGHYTKVSKFTGDIQSAIRQLGGTAARVSNSNSDVPPVVPEPSKPAPTPTRPTSTPTVEPTTPEPTTEPTTPVPTTAPTDPTPTATPTVPADGEYTNDTSQPLRDYQTVESTIDVGLQSASRVKVSIDLAHRCSQNLKIKLTAPTGHSSVLKRSRYSRRCSEWVGERSDTYNVSINPKGTWTLEISDEHRGNTGTLNSWSLKFTQ